MILGKNLKGMKLGELDALQVEYKKTLDDIQDAKKGLFNTALMIFTTKPTKEVSELDEKLHGKLLDVLNHFRHGKHEVILGSLHRLACKFGEDFDLAELLVNVGLFSKKFYHADTLHGSMDHEFESEEDMISSCMETCSETGMVLYFDPLEGIEVSKERFEKNTHYTILPTTLYHKIYSELLEVYQNLEVV